MTRVLIIKSKIERRTADRLEYVGGGGLLLQRFRKFARLRLHLVESAYIPDGDHAWSTKVLKSSTWFAVNAPGSLRETVITPIGFAIMEHGYGQGGSKSAQARAIAVLRARIDPRVRNINRRSLQNAASRQILQLPGASDIGSGETARYRAEPRERLSKCSSSPVKPGHQDGPCIKQAHCAFGDWRLSTGCTSSRRTGDDLQYLGHRRLLLAGFLQVLARTGDRATLSSGCR